MRPKRSFSPELLNRLRNMPIPSVLALMGLHWKPDPDFKPLKDKSTKRLYVSVGRGVVELLVTGVKWYDARTEQGGGGAVDLVMYLFREDFVSAVKRLEGVMGSTHS